MKKRTVPQLCRIVESFFRQWLAAQRQASPTTVATYKEGLRLLFLFASKKLGKPPTALEPEDLDRDMVLAFLHHLENERGNTVRTRNARLAAIRSFFRYAASCEPLVMGVAGRVSSIPCKRTVQKAISFLSIEELQAILNVPNKHTTLGRRDYALLLLLARTGARVSEAISVNASDVRMERPWHVLLRGKGSKERIVPLDANTVEVLRALCKQRNLPRNSDSPLFVNAQGQRLTRFGALHIVSRTVRVARQICHSLGKRAISPHTFRHTVAMQLLQAGVDLTTIRSWLGHVSVQTTHQYVEADIEMKRKALEKCEQPNGVLPKCRPRDKLLALLESL